MGTEHKDPNVGGEPHAQGGDEDICQDKSRTTYLESGWARLG